MMTPFQQLLQSEEKSLLCASSLPDLGSHQDDWQGIGFKLGDAELLSAMGDVKEILDTPEYTRVPGVKSWVVGIANVRGSLLPLIDLRSFVTGNGLKNKKDGRVLVVNYRGTNTGLIVDDVQGMRYFQNSEQAYELPDISEKLKPYIKKAFQRDGQYWPVFSFNTLKEDERFLYASL